MVSADRSGMVHISMNGLFLLYAIDTHPATASPTHTHLTGTPSCCCCCTLCPNISHAFPCIPAPTTEANFAFSADLDRLAIVTHTNMEEACAHTTPPLPSRSASQSITANTAQYHVIECDVSLLSTHRHELHVCATKAQDIADTLTSVGKGLRAINRKWGDMFKLFGMKVNELQRILKEVNFASPSCHCFP